MFSFVKRRLFVIIFAGIISVHCWTVSPYAQGIIVDVPNLQTTPRLDELKKQDSIELFRRDQQAKRNHYPLFVFIPGILGSKIEECDTKNGQPNKCKSIWGQKNWADSITSTDLRIRPQKIYRTSVLDNFKALGQDVDFYGDGLAYLHSLNISEYPSLFPFSYDWRQDNRESAMHLQAELCRLKFGQPNRPIIFIAHSMGGLVLKYWFARIYRKEICANGVDLKLNIKEIIFVGTPHYGAPEAIKTFAEGFKLEMDGSGIFGILKNYYSRKTVADELNRYGATFPSIYQLLPIYADSCMQSQRKMIVLPDVIKTHSGGTFDLFSVRAWKDAGWPKNIPVDVPNDAFYETLERHLSGARSFLCAVANAEIPPSIRTTYLSSQNHSTSSSFRLRAIPFSNSASARNTIGFDHIEMSEGDGTVPYEIGINSIDANDAIPRFLTDEKHEYLLNSKQFRARVSLIYRYAQAEVNEELLSVPRLRPRLKNVYLKYGRNLFASMPSDTEIRQMGGVKPSTMFAGVAEFNRTLAKERGLTAYSVRQLAQAVGTSEDPGILALVTSLESSNSKMANDIEPQDLSVTTDVWSSPNLLYSPWVKVCDKGPDTNNKQVCVVSKNRIENGLPVATIQLFEPEGDQKFLRVTVPLGMQLQQGTRVIIDQGQPAQQPYIMCFAVGCMADFPVSGEIVKQLKTGQQLTVQTINMNGTPITLSLPLGDFAKAYEGPATDPKVFDEQMRKLQEKADERRRNLEAKQPSAAAPRDPPVGDRSGEDYK